MGNARFGQFLSPLIIGALLSAGFATGQILIAAALFPGFAAVFVALLWLEGLRRGKTPATPPETPPATRPHGSH